MTIPCSDGQDLTINCAYVQYYRISNAAEVYLGKFLCFCGNLDTWVVPVGEQGEEGRMLAFKEVEHLLHMKPALFCTSISYHVTTDDRRMQCWFGG